MTQHFFRIIAGAVMSLTTVFLATAVAAGDHPESLTLEQALELAEQRHPQLAEARALVDASLAQAEQAGTLPNPEIVVRAEQLPVEREGSNQREYVAGVSQQVPLGGRLNKARQAELLEAEVRKRGLDRTRRELRRRVHAAFATALYQSRAFELQRQNATGYEKAAAITKARVGAGDLVPEELARVELELAKARAELRRSESLRGQSLLELTAATGVTQWKPVTLVGNLEETFELPAVEELLAQLSAHPESLEAEARIRSARAQINLAKAERVPDVKVEALYHRLEGTRENTIDVGLSIPLPLFNRNRGAIREAEAAAVAAEARAKTTAIELTTRLRTARLSLSTALENIRAFKNDILPRADTILKTAEARYSAGDMSLADVLPVRREWANIQLAYLESLRDAMSAWAELKTLLDSPRSGKHSVCDVPNGNGFYRQFRSLSTRLPRGFTPIADCRPPQP